MRATTPLTLTVALDKLDTEIVIAEQAAVPGVSSRRKLTYNPTQDKRREGGFDLWIGEDLVWSGAMDDAIKQYNEFDAGSIDYTPENLAYAGI